ncbi:MAG: lysylphosphatidylglycerol synthase transmembrane domain-containing protein [Clostridia bacterium]
MLKKILVVVLSLCVIAAIALLDPNVSDIDMAFAQVQPLWLILALCSMIVSYIGDTLIYHSICKLMNVRQGFADSLLTTMIGFFYSALTPFQSGGQPMQIIQMRKRGIPVGTGTSVLSVKFLAWQLSMMLLATAGLFFLGDTVMGNGVSARTLLYVGYGLNALLMLIILLALIRPGMILKAGDVVLAFLHRIKLIRHSEKYEKLCAGWENTISDYGHAVDFLLENKLRMIPMLLFGFLESFTYMLVTYCIYRGFGLSGYPLYHVVLLQALLTIAVSFVPLPGASVASEGGFYLVFSQLFGMTIRFPAMLLWRALTYYLSILLGLGAVIIDGFRKNPPQAPEQEN